MASRFCLQLVLCEHKHIGQLIWGTIFKCKNFQVIWLSSLHFSLTQSLKLGVVPATAHMDLEKAKGFSVYSCSLTRTTDLQKKKIFKNNASLFLVSRNFTPQNVFQSTLPWFWCNSQGSWLFEPTHLHIFLFDSLHPLICFYHWMRSLEKQKREIILCMALLLNTRNLSLGAWWPQSPESGMGLVWSWNSAADALPWIGCLPPASCLWRACCPCTTYWLTAF